MEDGEKKERRREERERAMDSKGNSVVVLVEDRTIPSPVPSTALCRICHEEEETSSTTMEAPCACSGTLKFAHRRCVQRWCDEKGGTLCEVCLQNFEPNYTVAPKKALIEVGVTIRQSVEISRLEGYGLSSTPLTATLFEEEEDDDPPECSPARGCGAACCHSIALTVTLVLLLRHLISVITTGADNYAFTIFTVCILRATGMMLPLYAVIRMAAAVKQLRREHRALSLPEVLESRDDLPLQEHSQSPQHSIHIHS